MITQLLATLVTVGAAQSDMGARSEIDVSADLSRAAEWVGRPAAEQAVDTRSAAAHLTYRRYAAPRPLRVWIVRIDLTADGVELVTSEPIRHPVDGVDRKYETFSRNTLEFARESDVRLAVNASAFDPFRSATSQPMEVVGLAADDGQAFSAPDERFGAMYISRAGRVVLQGPPLRTGDIWDVVPGFRMLVDDGSVAVSAEEAATKFGGLNPRTAVGTDREGTTLWLVVADGRQPGVSEGITLVELACLFRTLGVWDALNLDGGGSSTLVLQADSGEPQVVNTPVGAGAPNTLRQCANHLGVRLPVTDRR